MPSGGEGPFTVRVCYGDDERTCCEAEVDFPPCYLSGPSELAPGASGTYTPSLGMASATVQAKDMTVTAGPEAFVARLNDGVCEGTISVSYAGRLCGTRTVQSTIANTVGLVAGPSSLAPGETAYYAHNLTGATYTGTLRLLSQSTGGAVLMMPEGAAGSYTASWSGVCGTNASMTVAAYDEDDCATWPDTTPAGSGTFPGPGANVIINDNGVMRIFTIGSNPSYYAPIWSATPITPFTWALTSDGGWHFTHWQSWYQHSEYSGWASAYVYSATQVCQS
jgi:hypothetical protein